MKWVLAAGALVVVANGVVLVSAGRERAGPAMHTTVDVCASHLIGGGDSDDAPALRLPLAPDSLFTPAGLEPDGLRALGFSEAVIAAVGRARDSTFRRPRPRPAWVRLRQRGDSLREWTVTEVVPPSERLPRDSASIVVHGLVSVRERRNLPPAAPTTAHDHAAATGAPTAGVIHAAVIEVIPFQLHLDRLQIAALRAVLPDSSACAVKRQAVIASGANGGIWVESGR